jgi:hypothetical protein
MRKWDSMAEVRLPSRTRTPIISLYEIRVEGSASESMLEPIWTRMGDTGMSSSFEGGAEDGLEEEEEDADCGRSSKWVLMGELDGRFEM